REREESAGRCAADLAEFPAHPPSGTAGGSGREASATGNRRRARASRSWVADVLWSGSDRSLPARRDLRGQDPQGGQARRPTSRAAHEVRASDQPQDCEGSRAHHPPVGAGPRRSRHPMISRRAFIATVTGLIVAPLAAEGQETGKISRIGFL